MIRFTQAGLTELIQPMLEDRAADLLTANEPYLTAAIYMMRLAGATPDQIETNMSYNIGRRDTARLAFFYAQWLDSQEKLSQPDGES